MLGSHKTGEGALFPIPNEPLVPRGGRLLDSLGQRVDERTRFPPPQANMFSR